MRRETTCFDTLPPFDSPTSRVVRPKSGAKVGLPRSESASNAMRCAALCGTIEECASPAVDGNVELTRFSGHLMVSFGGVRHGQEECQVYAGV
jgi:hypothetical protein